ncbi:uncharacterized protein SCHCODRAFT_02637034 [Schizophyllum commune H4-8]|nr:uncharacterized protein SCHCODRAFT_02637034 [Schizophyllum commune H4-8]KAI5888557.1 hypothetical protein SCHCODRAFT_02637034 [Schizophyllum commune H4-8]
MEGRRGDLGLLDESKLVGTLKEKAIREGVPPDGPAEMRFLQLFGDPAYGVSYQILSPFMAEVRTAEEVRWNEMMGSVRVRVEHGFGQVSQKWPFLDAHSRMRVFASPVGIYYRFGVLMTNILNCFEPNSVATSFCCSPPSLAEYLHDEASQ